MLCREKKLGGINKGQKLRGRVLKQYKRHKFFDYNYSTSHYKNSRGGKEMKVKVKHTYSWCIAKGSLVQNLCCFGLKT